MKSLFFLLPLLYSLSASATEQLTICVDYHCEHTTIVDLDESDWQYVTSPFQITTSNAQQERQQVSQSIALFEKLIGKRTGTDHDIAQNGGKDKLGQLDCIAESRNTELYLQWLERKQLLNRHHTTDRQLRSVGIFAHHWSAFIQDKSTQQQFAIDSWHYKNGEPPVIQPADDWFNRKPVSNTVIP